MYKHVSVNIYVNICICASSGYAIFYGTTAYLNSVVVGRFLATLKCPYTIKKNHVFREQLRFGFRIYVQGLWSCAKLGAALLRA